MPPTPDVFPLGMKEFVEKFVESTGAKRNLRG